MGKYRWPGPNFTPPTLGPALVFLLLPLFPFLMRVFYFLAVASGLALTLSAAAQKITGIGPRLGGNLSSATFDGLDLLFTSKAGRSAVAGVQVGLAASFGAGHWAVQPALVFTQKGVQQDVTETVNFQGVSLTVAAMVTSRVHYLELPLNVVYATEADGQGFQLFAGPYLAAGVGGAADYNANATIPGQPTQTRRGSQPFAFGDTFTKATGTKPDARTRRFDAGLNLGIGYRRGPVQAQVGYGLGLRNVQSDYPASDQQPIGTGYNRGFQLTATYFLPTGGGR